MTEEKKTCCGGESTEGCCGDQGGCCGGHDHDHDHGDQVPVLHLELEDGTEMPCFVLEILDIEDKSYIALLPEGDEAFMIYEYKEEGEEVSLANIPGDDEYERIAKIFEEHFGQEEEE